MNEQLFLLTISIGFGLSLGYFLALTVYSSLGLIAEILVATFYHIKEVLRERKYHKARAANRK